MDPLTAAIILGAGAGLKEGATQAVRDAYNAIRNLLTSRYPTLDLRPLEENAGSATERESLSADLVERGALEDAELLESARSLVETVEREDPQSAASLGVDLNAIRAEFITIARVVGGVRAQDVQTKGGISISDIQHGWGADPKP
ncbi:hypothetical protein [Streptosporangium sp. H16]|uniref:hypothetical protein n=1 Tax=Streptosporangium sp. H16 TaxID=3444184 RepID=UPI003F7A15C4